MNNLPPAPWKVAKDPDGNWIDVYDAAESIVAIAWVNDERGDPLASAKLIASAPDLLATLQSIARIAGAEIGDSGFRNIEDAARAAIARVEGRA